MVVVAAGKWGHNMDVQEVHIMEAPCRRVHSSNGLCSPSWI